MLFVDGENFTMRGQQIAVANARSLAGVEHYRQDVYLWFPGDLAGGVVNQANLYGPQESQPKRSWAGLPALEPKLVRAYYYAMLQGDQPAQEEVEEKLWELGFAPRVFKKERGEERAKGVDIALCCDVLAHGASGNYDVAVLVAGDRDYVPLIEEVKRLGRIAVVAFFDEWVRRELVRASDAFFDLTGYFLEKWPLASPLPPPSPG
jgi:hypothetical protein